MTWKRMVQKDLKDPHCSTVSRGRDKLMIWERGKMQRIVARSLEANGPTPSKKQNKNMKEII